MYQMATFAPASAYVFAIERPMPAGPPLITAVLPFRLNSDKMLLGLGATVLLVANKPSGVIPPSMIVRIDWRGRNDSDDGLEAARLRTKDN